MPVSRHTFAILAYQESPYLEDCIKSLKNQTIKNNIIICTSTPNKFLEKLAKKYDLPLKINTKQNGIASDWNFALHSVKSGWVTLAHQDDIYLPNFTKETLTVVQKNDQQKNLIAFTDYGEIVENGKEPFIRDSNLNLKIKRLLNFLAFGKKDIISKQTQKRRLLKFGSPIPAPSVTYNLDLLSDFNFSSQFSINMDWDAWERLSKKDGAFLRVKDVLMRHRIHTDSATTKGVAENRRQREDEMIFGRFWGKTMTSILIKVYGLSLRSNKIKT